MNFKNLKTVVVAAAAFAVFGLLALLNLPEGPPRYIAAAVVVAVGIAVYVKAHRDADEDLM